jgi:hypothetical protein
MKLSLANARGFALACPSGSALVNSSLVNLTASYVSVTLFVGIVSSTVVQ